VAKRITTPTTKEDTMAQRGRPKKPTTLTEAIASDRQLKAAITAFSTARTQVNNLQSQIFTTQYKLRATFEQQEMIEAVLAPANPPSDDQEQATCQRMQYLLDNTSKQMAELARELAYEFDALVLAQARQDQAANARSKRHAELCKSCV